MTTEEQVVSRILRDVPQPIWVVDADGHITFANPSAVAALGYEDNSEFLGKPSHSTVHYSPPDRPGGDENCVLLAPARTGRAAHGEAESFIRRDGSLFPIAWWSSPIDLPTGRGVVLAFTDITQRRRAEQTARERDAATIRATEAKAAQRRIMEQTTEIRRQIARNLHDGAQQRLVALMVGLELARSELAPGDSDLRVFLDGAVTETQCAIDELREFVAGLHPPTLHCYGLMAAIQGLADRMPIPSRITSNLGKRRLPESVEASAYYAVAEAMANAVKHARANCVTVSVEFDGTALDISVTDNGIGGARIGAGSGLIGLVDRIGAHDGTIDVDAARGGGTTVRIAIPVDPRIARRQKPVTPGGHASREV
ncbi:PAS domain-containing sensor histidine kinase [Pseudonocardia alaniniphila]|uniref:histidine kinase n=1 Tax=Pseudonocardia alaniniphila TaxID=75291 RepID=A0ABS9TRK1_9PSEU|nr:PAS domain S-box protein [Pseudonocardia alaniniphila]MCH6171183.1 PAS domain S-box protein [Pseudonocardia alaniniphila]